MSGVISPVSPLTYVERVRRGEVPGASVVCKFGRNDDVGTSWEHVWLGGGIYAWPTSASTLEVISTSTNDTAAGSGAQEITIEGLDANFDAVSEAVATNGTSASTATTASFVRVNRAYVSSCGTYNGSNEGTVTVRISSGGATQAVIGVESSRGLGQTLIARYTVPSGKRAYLFGTKVSVEGTKTADVALYQRQNADDVSTPFSARRLSVYYDGISGSTDFSNLLGQMYPEKTDIWWEALAAVANTQISVTFELLVENT